MNVDIFYVYVILDTRYEEESTYLGYSFPYRPIYVGKGKGNRKDVHLYKSRLNENSGNRLKNNVLNKILSEGYQPQVMVLEDSLSENESFELEEELIHTIGRRDLDKGYLTNLTDGGEGQSGSISFIKEDNPFYGRKHSKATRNKLSKPIKRLNTKGEIIDIFPSITNACKELGMTDSKLRDCLKGRTKLYRGFMWEYINEEHKYDSQEYYREEYDYISQMDLDGIEVKQWESVSHIVDSVNKIHKSGLIDCLKGRKNTCNGYIWRYIK